MLKLLTSISKMLIKINNLHCWAMSQKLPVSKLEWIEDTSQCYKDFIKNYNEGSNEGYFLEADVHYPEKLNKLQLAYQIYLEKKDSKSLLLSYMINLNMSFT